METNQDTLHLPSVYAKVNEERPPEYYQVDDLKINWSTIEHYRVVQKIGRGKYSEVFEGVNQQNWERVCIKVLKPVRTVKILREVKILQNLCGGPNIIQLLDIARDEASRTPCLVFNYIENVGYRKLFQKFTDLDLRIYMYKLLEALDYCHSNGIIHRDVKPQNIMFDYDTKDLFLIDWGLAEFYIPNQKYNVRVASRYYKGPELLVDDQRYHYSLDIWSAGCSLAEIMFKKDPFFFGDDNLDQLIKIAKVMGTDDLLEYMKKYDLSVNPYHNQRLDRWPKKKFQSFINSENKALVSEDGIDLLEKMLVYDKNNRITAREAMTHKYFNPVRALKKIKQNNQ